MLLKWRKCALVLAIVVVAELALSLLKPRWSQYSPIDTGLVAVNCVFGLVSFVALPPVLELALFLLDFLNDVVYCYQEIFDDFMRRSTVQRRSELRYHAYLQRLRSGVYP